LLWNVAYDSSPVNIVDDERKVIGVVSEEVDRVLVGPLLLDLGIEVTRKVSRVVIEKTFWNGEVLPLYPDVYIDLWTRKLSKYMSV